MAAAAAAALEDLADDILLHIFRRLDGPSLASIGIASSHLHRLSSVPSLWLNLYIKPKTSPPPPNSHLSLLLQILTMSSPPENTKPQTDSTHNKSSSDLFSSAKVLADAARSALDGAAFDKSKVAGASEDLLDGASEYGKLREKGYGSYLDKAEGYLHQFQSSDQKSTHSSSPPHDDVKLTPEEKSTAPLEEKSAPEERKSGGGFGGFGDYANLAEGFFKK